MNTCLKYAPAVMVLGEEYIITLPVNCPCTAEVQIGGEAYFDSVGGVLRTETDLHRIFVPQKALDGARGYRVILTPLPGRTAYHNHPGTPQRTDYTFRPFPAEGGRIFAFSDTHTRFDIVLQTAKTAGNYDALLLGGDIWNDADSDADSDLIFRLCDALSGGSIPVMCFRGNHEARGCQAERYCDRFPSVNGKLYYTLRLGSLWMLVLDCGEDKEDSCDEYGGVNVFSDYRRKETRYLQSLVSSPEKEWEKEDVRYRMLFSHIPFTDTIVEKDSPFDIEIDTYREWTALADRFVQPHVMLAGHNHVQSVKKGERGARFDTVVISAVGGHRIGDNDGFSASLAELKDGAVTVTFCHSDGTVTPAGTFKPVSL